MPTCIYCRTQTTGKEGLPHVIPEALGPNDLVLPRGAECDKCNHYFGRKLEPNLYRYPGVAFALQFWGIHGKKGLRKRLSTIERTDEGKTQASGHAPPSIPRSARFTTLRRAGERSSFFSSLTTSSPSLCATMAPSPRMPPRRGTS